ncbi:MAG: hypothetical protein K6F76_07945 [Clostridiales bacterium]|nr:hypothetical protein [Clostridiales bacterium]
MKTFLIFLICALIILLPFGCSVKDPPPQTDKPQPGTLNGEYVSPHGTFIFNGDGGSIKINIDDTLSQATGLPSGESEGTYVFLLSNGMYRYDLAEYMQITVGDKTVRLPNAHGETDENAIILLVSVDSDNTVKFEKNQ